MLIEMLDVVSKKIVRFRRRYRVITRADARSRHPQETVHEKVSAIGIHGRGLRRERLDGVQAFDMRRSLLQPPRTRGFALEASRLPNVATAPRAPPDLIESREADCPNECPPPTPPSPPPSPPPPSLSRLPNGITQTKMALQSCSQRARRRRALLAVERRV